MRHVESVAQKALEMDILHSTPQAPQPSQRGRVASREQPMLARSSRSIGALSEADGALPGLPSTSSLESARYVWQGDPAERQSRGQPPRGSVATRWAEEDQQEEDEAEWRNPVSFDDPWVGAPMIKVPKRRQVCWCMGESHNYRERYRTGRIAYERRHLEEAEAALRDAVELNRECLEAWTMLGQVLADQERDAEAEECYSDALAIDRHYLLAHFGLGMLQSRQGRIDESISHFDACLEIDPSHNDARRALTAALNDLGRPRDAIVHFEQAIGKAEDAMSSNRITLTFHANNMETEFTARRAQRSAPGTRLLLVMAFVQQLLLLYSEDVEGNGEQALETGIEEIAAIEREEEAIVAGEADPSIFSPASNAAFADCYLTPLEIETDAQARAFATALFLATGDVDIHGLPLRSRGIATDGVVEHRGATDWGTSPPCASGVQPWGLASWQEVYFEQRGAGYGPGNDAPTATGDSRPPRGMNGTSESGMVPTIPPGTKGTGGPPPTPVVPTIEEGFEPLPIGQLNPAEEEEEMFLVWLNELDHDRTFLWLDIVIMVVTTTNFFYSFHHSFFRVKTLLLSLSMVLFVFTELLETTFLLVDSDLHYDERDELLAAMSTELVQTIMTTHIHFSLLLVFPQLFGLRWITMLVVCAVVLGLFLPIWMTFGSAWIFFPPHYMTCILFFVLVTAFWVEGFERAAFRTDRLLFIQKECVAQYQADWRKAESLRFRSELAVTEARSALRTRNEMTAFIFHEIRNPLNAMLGAIQMIATTVQTVRERKWAQIAINTMGMVSNVLNDVLFLSKIEAGKVILHKSPFSVAEMLEETAFMFSEQAKQKGIALVCHCANGAHQFVIGDEGRLKEALANFCSNAIKFTDGVEGASVTLMADQMGDNGNSVDLNIHVTDTGRGLAESEKAKLFVPFQTLRDDERQSNQTKGTGLGLVISKHIIVAHGGEVYVESEGEGRGSRFGFKISLEKAEGAQEMGSPRWSEGRTSDGTALSTAPPMPEGISVLLVDDDEFNLEVVSDMLLSLGWVVQTATNGTQALRHLGISDDGSAGTSPHKSKGAPADSSPADSSCGYSCIVTDNIMPVLNGRDLTRRCRQELAESCPPIIGLTGSAQLDDLRACKDAGMDTVLTKPVRLGDLAAAVRSAVATAHSHSSVQAKKARAGLAPHTSNENLGHGHLQRQDGANGVARQASNPDGREAFSPLTDEDGVNSLAAAANALDALDGLDDFEDMLMDHQAQAQAQAQAADESPSGVAGGSVNGVAARQSSPGRAFPTIPGLQIEGLATMRPRQSSHLSGGSSGSDGASAAAFLSSSDRDGTPPTSRPRGRSWGGEQGQGVGARPAMSARSTLSSSVPHHTPTTTDNPLRGGQLPLSAAGSQPAVGAGQDGGWEDGRPESAKYGPSVHHDL